MPPGLRAARVREGVAVLETEAGQPVGTVKLQPGGWYFTPAGYEALFLKLAEWQVRLDSLESTVSAATPAPPPPAHPLDGWALLSALLLGLALGAGLSRLLSTRRTRSSP